MSLLASVQQPASPAAPTSASPGAPRCSRPTAAPPGGKCPTPPESSTPRRVVVLNCSNIGFTYATAVRERGGQPADRFDWEGVRQAVQYYMGEGVFPIAVCKNRTAVCSPVPEDLAQYVTLCPVVDDVHDADDLFTIRMAMRYACQYVDNDNYRDWKHQADKHSSDDDLRAWLTAGDGARLKVSYLFDRFLKYVPLKPALSGPECGFPRDVPQKHSPPQPPRESTRPGSRWRPDRQQRSGDGGRGQAPPQLRILTRPAARAKP